MRPDAVRHTDRHLIEPLRDTCDVPGADHLTQEIGVSLWIHAPLPEHQRRLVEDFHEHVPQPHLLPGKLVLAAVLQAAVQVFEGFRRPDAFQQAVHGARDPVAVRIADSLGKFGKRFGDPFADVVDAREDFGFLVPKGFQKAARVFGPFLAPFSAADFPQEHIVFEFGDLVLGESGKPRLEPREHVVRLEPAAHDPERAQHKAHERLRVDGARAVEKGRDLPAFQRGREARVVGFHRSDDDGEIAVPVAVLHHKASDGQRGEFGFVVAVARLVDGDGVGFFGI